MAPIINRKRYIMEIYVNYNPYFYINVLIFSSYIYYKLRDIKMPLIMLALVVPYLASYILHNVFEAPSELSVTIMKIVTVVSVIVLLGMFLWIMIEISKDEKKEHSKEFSFLIEKRLDNYVFWAIVALVNVVITLMGK